MTMAFLLNLFQGGVAPVMRMPHASEFNKRGRKKKTES